LGYSAQLPSKNVGASIARPAVLYHKTASPQGDISLFSFGKSSNCLAICWRTANGRPYKAFYNCPRNGNLYVLIFKKLLLTRNFVHLQP
jgi:hypothetical protein